MDFATRDRLIALERLVAEIGSEIARLPVREAKVKGGGSVNVIVAETVGAVAAIDATYNFDSAVAIKGAAPPGGTGVAQNTFGETLAADERVVFIQGDDGHWYPDRAASGTGVQLVYFELVEDKVYAAAHALAKPVDAAGDIISAADPFYVVDDARQYWGLAAGPDGTTAATPHVGYRGFAVLFATDYSEGVPGWRIIAMEGPADLLAVTVNSAPSSGAAPCTLLGTNELFAGPPAQRLPRLESDSADVTVYDDITNLFDLPDPATGEKWLVKWDREDERYVFVWKLKGAAPTSLLRWGEAEGTITKAEDWGDWGGGMVQFKDHDGDDDGEPVEVENWYPTEFSSGAVICCDTTFDPPRIVSASCDVMAPEE